MTEKNVQDNNNSFDPNALDEESIWLIFGITIVFLTLAYGCIRKYIRSLEKLIPSEFAYFSLFTNIVIMMIAIAICYYLYIVRPNSISKSVDIKKQLDLDNKFNIGDIIKFDFLPQHDISNKSVEVIQINCDEQIEKKRFQYIVKDKQNQIFYLKIQEEYGKEIIAISKKYGRLRQLFKSDRVNRKKISKNTMRCLEGTHHPNRYEDWLTFPLKNMGKPINRKKIINLDISKYNDGHFLANPVSVSTFLFTDDENKSAIEFEYNHVNHVDVFLTVKHPISCIQKISE